MTSIRSKTDSPPRSRSPLTTYVEARSDLGSIKLALRNYYQASRLSLQTEALNHLRFLKSYTQTLDWYSSLHFFILYFQKHAYYYQSSAFLCSLKCSSLYDSRRYVGRDIYFKFLFLWSEHWLMFCFHNHIQSKLSSTIVFDNLTLITPSN